MKSTGLIKKIDELGRIVIPKDIRKNLRVKTGDNFEIYIDDSNIILKKFSMLEKINDLAQTISDAASIFMEHSIFITDTDNIIASSGKVQKDYINKHISQKIEESINRREKLLENHFKKISIIDDDELLCSYVTNTIIVSGEAMGMVIILSENHKLGETEMQMANIISSFIAKNLEE